jgi:hypothetical protein
MLPQLVVAAECDSKRNGEIAYCSKSSYNTFFMLAKIVLPLLMPSTTDVKLSSSSTIDAASRDTSEPVIAIAIPISARLSAGLV